MKKKFLSLFFKNKFKLKYLPKNVATKDIKSKKPTMPVSERISKYKLCGCVEHNGCKIGSLFSNCLSHSILKFFSPTPITGFFFHNSNPETNNFP